MSSLSFKQLVQKFPLLSSLKQVPQNPEFHAEGDVYTHTELVCACLPKQPFWDTLLEQEKDLLILSACFHDIGKLSCTRIENGTITSRYHAIKGSRLFRALVYRSFSSFPLFYKEREQIAGLIRYHGLPLHFLDKQNPELELLRAAELINLKYLYLLSRADALGRICKDTTALLEQIDYFAEYAKELGCFESPYPFFNSYTKYVYFHHPSFLPPLYRETQLFDSTEFDVTILCGLPLSGKDTWILEHQNGQKVISLDDIRRETGIPPTKGSTKVASIAKERAKILLRKKEPFIWNATNLTEEIREKLTSLFFSYGARVHFLYLEVPYPVLYSRAQKRERKVPEYAIEKMIDILQPPAPFEGYDRTIIFQNKEL